MIIDLNTKVIIHDGIEGKVIKIFKPDKYFRGYRYKVAYKTPLYAISRTIICNEGNVKIC